MIHFLRLGSNNLIKLYGQYNISDKEYNCKSKVCQHFSSLVKSDWFLVLYVLRFYVNHL